MGEFGLFLLFIVLRDMSPAREEGRRRGDVGISEWFIVLCDMSPARQGGLRRDAVGWFM